MMTSKELVKAAIFHKNPDRLPVKYDCFGCSDVAWIPVLPSASFRPSVDGEDEWGCVWDHTDVKNMGQVKGHPFTDGVPDDLAKTKFPNYDDDSRYIEIEAALDRAEAEGKYATAGLFMVLFERMHSLCGFENALCALMDEDEREDMERLAAHIADVQIQYVRNLGKRFSGRIHSINSSDDWGTQQAAFVSSEFWMDFFFPHYKRIFDAMHEEGFDVWVHSCGKVNEIIECYIAAGVDVVNLQQPRALGIEEIGNRYRGRIAFESLCDIQHTLPTGRREEVDKDVEALAAHWMDKSGGFFFSDYGDSSAIGVTDPTIKLYMYEKMSEASERIYGNPLPTPQMPVEAQK